MADYAEVWKRLSPTDKRRTFMGGALCFLGFVLTVDMYFLKQRPDFQQKFNLPAEGEDEQGPEDKPWKRKQQAQIDAEIAARTAQLAAAKAGIPAAKPAAPATATAAAPAPAGVQQQATAAQPAPAAAQPAAAAAAAASGADEQPPAKSWWSVKFKR